MERDKENQKSLSDLKIAEIKNFAFYWPWKIFILEAFLFFLTLGLGLISAFKLNQILEIERISLPKISFWSFFITFLLASLFLFFIISFLKFKKTRGVIFKFIFILAVGSGSLAFLEVWLPQFLSLFVVVFLIFWWWRKPLVLNHDLLMILGLVGVGSILGLALEPRVVIALLIIFSIYDYVAVLKTKHMVEIAREMIEQKAILAFVVPPNFSEFKSSLAEVKAGGKFLILGGGDIAFPLIFLVSLIPTGILKTVIVAIFSLMGLFFSFYIFVKQKLKKPIPALPPIALFLIIGYLLTLVL